MGLDQIRTIHSIPCIVSRSKCSHVIIMFTLPLCHLNMHVIGSHTNTFWLHVAHVWFEAWQTQICEYELYRHPHTWLHPLSCSSPPALSTTPYLLLSAWLLWASSLVPFLFSISSLFLAARAANGAEVFHQSSLVVFRVLCLPKVPGSCLDLWENIGTITR